MCARRWTEWAVCWVCWLTPGPGLFSSARQIGFRRSRPLKREPTPTSHFKEPGPTGMSGSEPGAVREKRASERGWSRGRKRIIGVCVCVWTQGRRRSLFSQLKDSGPIRPHLLKHFLFLYAVVQSCCKVIWIHSWRLCPSHSTSLETTMILQWTSAKRSTGCRPPAYPLTSDLNTKLNVWWTWPKI